FVFNPGGRAMNPRIRMPVFGVLLLFALSGLAHAGESSPLSASTQLVIVTTADWGSVSGQAQLFEKHSPRDHWRRVGDPFEIVVGGAGLPGAPAFFPPMPTMFARPQIRSKKKAMAKLRRGFSGSAKPSVMPRNGSLDRSSTMWRFHPRSNVWMT